MRKGQLKDGTAFLGIKIEHFVTRSTFAHAIASHYWTRNEDFNSRSSKRDVMKILETQLFHQGNEGLQRDHWDGASEEFVKPYQNTYEAACEWIDKNYPYLNQPF